jgi:hypothetical protein
MRFEVLTPVKMTMLFWVLTPCGFEAGSIVSEKRTVSILSAECRRGQCVSLKLWKLSTCESTRHQNPQQQQQHRHPHCCEKLKFAHKAIILLVILYGCETWSLNTVYEGRGCIRT